MKIIYTNISPVTNTYTNFHHLFHLKKQKPQKVYLCIWDNFVFEHPVFERSLNNVSSKKEQLEENVKVLKKLMTYLSLDYKIIYLSEAMDRLFKNSGQLSIFQNILSEIKLENLKKGFGVGYTQFGKLTVSHINYIISDYLIATALPDLFPEICSSMPNYYLTSLRFKAFSENINKHLTKQFTPLPLYTKDLPFIIHPKKEIMPCMEMSIEEIKNIVNACYNKKPVDKEVYELVNILSALLDEFFINRRETNKRKIFSSISELKDKEFFEFITINLYNYFRKIKEITSKVEIEKQKKTLFVSDCSEFEKYLKSLNKIKLEIIKNCDGNSTSLDITRKTGFKLSTVSTYLTHLKNKGLIGNSKKPKRLIDNLVIDFDIISKN